MIKLMRKAEKQALEAQIRLDAHCSAIVDHGCWSQAQKHTFKVAPSSEQDWWAATTPNQRPRTLYVCPHCTVSVILFEGE